MTTRHPLTHLGGRLLLWFLPLAGIVPGGLTSLMVHAATPGTVVAWGSNSSGETTVPVTAQSGVTAIAAGGNHTVALRRDGSVEAWGGNDSGQTTVPMAAQSGVTAIAAGANNTVALKTDGSVLVWGDSTDNLTTVPVAARTKVMAVAAGFGHIVALKTDGSVVAWGRNSEGQTNVPATAKSGVMAIAAGKFHTVALKTDGSVIAWGGNGAGQTTVPAAAKTQVTAIAAGDFHTLALKSGGSVVAWGDLFSGATDVPATAQSGVAGIAAGAFHSVALKTDGSVVAWGDNRAGQRTVPVQAQSGVTVVAAGAFHSVALRTKLEDGFLDPSFGTPAGAEGSGVYASVTQPDGKVVVAGHFYLLFGQPSSGVARFNRDGSLDTTFQTIANTAGEIKALALQPDGKLLAGGTLTLFNNRECHRLVRLNSDGTTDTGFNLSGCDDEISAIAVQADGRILVGGHFTNIAGGARPRLARLNADGSLDAAFTTAGTPGNVFTVAVDAAGQLLVGGDFNEWGGAPSGHFLRLMPDGAVDGSFHPARVADLKVNALRLEPDGRILVAGASDEAGSASAPRFARLRDDGTLDPAFASVVDVGGSAAAEVYSMLHLPGGGYAIGGNFQALNGQPRWMVARLKPDGSLDAAFDTSVGADVPCAGAVGTLDLDAQGDLIVGGLFCVVDGRPWMSLARLHNTLPPHVVDPGFTPPLTPFIPASSVTAWGRNLEGQTNVPDGLNDVVALAAGHSHSLALKRDGSVVAWGNNIHGQATVPTGLGQVTAIAAKVNHSMALKRDGTVVTWGQNGGPVPVGLNEVKAIAAGLGLGLALKRDGTVVAWGNNEFGQASVPTGLGGVAAVAAGERHSVALKTDGTVVAWGWDVYGQANVPIGLSGVAAIAAGYANSLALKSDGTVVAWGEGPGAVPSGLGEVTAIAAGDYHAAALKRDGSVVVWGLNGDGQTNIPAGLTGVSGIAAGGYHTLALKMAGPSVVAVVAEPDGGVTAGGSFPAGPDGVLRPGLRRFKTDGSLDPAFHFNPALPVGRMARQPDGRLLVSLFEAHPGGAASVDLLRLDPDGSRDASFAPFSFHDYREPLGRFEAAADGRIYLIAPGSINAEPYTTRLRRLLPDGTVDRSFAVPFVSTGSSLVEERIQDFALQTDGRVVIAGGFTQLQSRVRGRVARLNLDGSLDTTFGNPGVAGGDVRFVGLQPDGRVVIAGDFTAVNSPTSPMPRSGLARLAVNGTPDPSFNPAVAGHIESFSLEPDGHILLGISVADGSGWRAIRLDPDGLTDPSFGLGAGPAPASPAPEALIPAGDGSYYVAGSFTSYDGQPRPALVRLLPDSAKKFIPAGFAADNVDAAETDTSAKVVARRTGDASQPLTLDYAVENGSATDGADFVAATGTFAFAAGETETSFNVALHDDAVHEGDEVADLRLSTTDGTPLEGRDHIWLTVHDDEPPAGYVDRSFAPPGGPGWAGGPGGITYVSALPDGGVLVAGFFDSFGELADLGNLLRFRADGAVDESWVARTDVYLERPPALQADGKILVAGRFSNVDGEPRRILARLNADGSLDGSFAQFVSSLADALPSQVVPLADGRILLAGRLGILTSRKDGDTTAVLQGDGVVRLLADGRLDPSFTPFSVSEGQVLSVAPSPAGGVYLAGIFDLLSAGGGRRVARLKPDGMLDTTFKPNVRYDTLASQVLVQPDGRVLIAGNFAGIGDEENPVNVATLARLLPSGAVDLSFVCRSTENFGWIRLLADGKILCGGERMHVGGAYRSGLVRLNADGTTDLSFQPDLELAAEPVNAALTSGDVDSAGRVLVVGPFVRANGEPRPGIARLFGVPPVSQVGPQPAFRFAVTATNVPEAAGEVVLTVVKDSAGAGGVNYATQAGTAGPFDFTAASGFLDFAATDASKTIHVPIFNDFLEEAAETFTMTLSSATGDSPPSVATVTIIDDDAGVASRSLLDIHFPGAPSATTGRVRVDVLPVDIGGGWRFRWEEAWRAGGSTADKLEPGNYDLEFKPVAGWIAPSAAVVSVVVGPTTVHPAAYAKADTVAAGRLTVILDPPDLRDRAGWRLAGETAYRSSGETAADIPAGIQIMEFAPVAGRVAPGTREVKVAAGVRSEVTATYLLADAVPIGVETPKPLPNLAAVTDSVLQNPALPYAFNGQVRGDAGLGSGFVVRERVVLTAAHLVFDDRTLAPVGDAEWFLQRQAGEFEPRPLRARGWYQFSGYAAQREAEATPGVATLKSHNLDAAALWFAETTWRGGQGGYLLTDDTHEWLLPAAEARQKLLVGYPVDGAAFGRVDIVPGRMHATFPGNYAFTAPSPQTRATTGFISFPGNSGGSVNVLQGGRYFPAAIYLGADAGRSSCRVIDHDVADLIARAASAAEVGTNYNGGGVITFVDAARGSAGSLQTLTVNFSPPAAAAVARWKLLGQPDTLLRAGGAGQTLLAPTNVVVSFTAVAGFTTPADIAVELAAGQNAILDVTYEPAVGPAPQLSASLADGLSVSGPSGVTVRLQFRAALGVGDWADVAGKSFQLGAVPVTVLTPAEGSATPGFYRVVVAP